MTNVTLTERSDDFFMLRVADQILPVGSFASLLDIAYDFEAYDGPEGSDVEFNFPGQTVSFQEEIALQITEVLQTACDETIDDVVNNISNLDADEPVDILADIWDRIGEADNGDLHKTSGPVLQLVKS